MSEGREEQGLAHERGSLGKIEAHAGFEIGSHRDEVRRTRSKRDVHRPRPAQLPAEFTRASARIPGGWGQAIGVATVDGRCLSTNPFAVPASRGTLNRT